MEDDDVIRQMRNDTSLREYKMKYIQEMVREEMECGMELQRSEMENGELKEMLRKSEESKKIMSKEFAEEIETIERDCQQMII